jgi:hypothetical protein
LIEIPLRNKAREIVAVALVDDIDASLAGSTWYLQKKGVRLDNLRGRTPRYRAQIRSDGSLLNLGMYSTPEAAAHAYDQAARVLFGEFAAVNFA